MERRTRFDSLASAATKQERRLRIGAQIAREASAILKKAGFAKAGRYYTFGAADSGYSARAAREKEAARVIWVLSQYGHPAGEVEAMMAAINRSNRLTAELVLGGLIVTRKGRHGRTDPCR